jgi:hypothetical protein
LGNLENDVKHAENFDGLSGAQLAQTARDALKSLEDLSFVVHTLEVAAELEREDAGK